MGIKVVLNNTIKTIINEIIPTKVEEKDDTDNAFMRGYNFAIERMETNFKDFCDSIVDDEVRG